MHHHQLVVGLEPIDPREQLAGLAAEPPPAPTLCSHGVHVAPAAAGGTQAVGASGFKAEWITFPVRPFASVTTVLEYKRSKERERLHCHTYWYVQYHQLFLCVQYFFKSYILY